MKNIIFNRIKKLSDTLKEKGVDVALIMQNADMFYYSNTIPSGSLAISNDNRAIFMIRRGYKRAQIESPIEKDSLIPVKGLRESINILNEHSIKFNTIGIEKDVLPVEIFERLQKIFKNSRFVDISGDIRWQRSRKNSYEIGLMKKAAKMLDETMNDAKKILKSGMKEIEASAELEYRTRKRGHQGLCRMRGFNGEVFMGHVHSGARSAYPSAPLKPTAGLGPYISYPEGASFEKIEANTPITVDFLGNYSGYMSDETRIFTIGHLEQSYVKAYNFCRKVLEWMEDYAKPGVIAEEIYYKSLEMAEKAGYKDSFMGIQSNQVPFVGHGVGIELDEFPFIAKNQDYPLSEGMTYAFEPKIAFENRGAVGIENTYLVTKSGVESFNKYSREITYL